MQIRKDKVWHHPVFNNKVIHGFGKEQQMERAGNSTPKSHAQNGSIPLCGSVIPQRPSWGCKSQEAMCSHCANSVVYLFVREKFLSQITHRYSQVKKYFGVAQHWIRKTNKLRHSLMSAKKRPISCAMSWCWDGNVHQPLWASKPSVRIAAMNPSAACQSIWEMGCVGKPWWT